MFKSGQCHLDDSFTIVHDHLPLAEIKKKLDKYKFVVVAGGAYFIIHNYEYRLIELGNESTKIIDWLESLNWLPSTVVSTDMGYYSDVDWRRPVLVKNEKEIIGILTSEQHIERLEEQKRQLLAYFQTLAETINDSVTAVDEAGEVLYWNLTAEETYKIKKEHIIGKKIGEHFSDESIVLHRILNEGLPVRGQYHRPNKDTHVLINASPIMVDNKIIGGVATEHNITNIIRLNEELDSNSALLVPKSNPFGKMVSGSPKFQEALKIAQKVAHADIPVHLTGEPGSGKEMLAQAIHYGGTKADGPFITLNCSVIPPGLLEIELFGFQKDIYSTDQQTLQIGRIEQALNGTLFIEDIDKMPLSIQGKLLDYLIDYRFYRVGGVEEIISPTRIITSTSQSIDVLLREGNFNEKLYYHLSVISIDIPPLRLRKEDIVSLAKNYIQEFSSNYKKPAPDIDSEVITQLVNYDWPGNVRELRNTIERIILLNDKRSIMSEHLPENIRSKEMVNLTSSKKGEINRQEQGLKNSEALEIEEALRKTYGNKSAAASLLGISRGTLYNKIKEYGLS
ncbi:PAS domain S-box-containing protein [Neobacillus niacini]|jgi:sigma-54 dependent transcriptional regulator, acetoin dehydrogenase operon transcriptional activator AcoR|uniref:sigma-54 interaction domain-containing protein n=1 Tax=Neobacillus niacini TaxID=86668 RepID=UPI00277F8500|nr:sigma 54-interacting transcriptional regulator [Neobacillus niacini]MDQ1003619.1 PAS domain S-box-containing protein [Neobacillus niacini]